MKPVRRQQLRVLNDRDERVIHVRHMGESRDIGLERLGLSGTASDDEVFRALARYLEIPADDLKGHVLERHPNGNMTLRPEAVFGGQEPVGLKDR
ncbi:MAG: hypothetical protein HY815_29580 [Candidatus Riflebacteria bacterium]|nr:hypothetical protein [Candidatus Riflebacteria bacterium]